jgi:pimeloyl-ACP methyl ester carboxylesterase
MATTQHLTLGTVPLTVTTQGGGHPFLLLHGGGGPQTVAAFADLLATTRDARVITPVHPGFGGTARPDHIADPHALAALYVELLDHLDLSDVTVVGNSIGGWIAAEMALLHSPRITSVVLVDAVGIEDVEHPVVDFFSLTMPEITQLSFHNPAASTFDPSALTDAERLLLAGNRATLRTLGGTSMLDSTLAARLADVAVPTLVVWGESDQIVLPDYGRTFAAGIPGAVFLLLSEAGHLPQIERPEQLLVAVWNFADEHARNAPTL